MNARRYHTPVWIGQPAGGPDRHATRGVPVVCLSAGGQTRRVLLEEIVAAVPDDVTAGAALAGVSRPTFRGWRRAAADLDQVPAVTPGPDNLGATIDT